VNDISAGSCSCGCICDRRQRRAVDDQGVGHSRPSATLGIGRRAGPGPRPTVSAKIVREARRAP
jgi:hypothetical protein